MSKNTEIHGFWTTFWRISMGKTWRKWPKSVRKWPKSGQKWLKSVRFYGENGQKHWFWWPPGPIPRGPTRDRTVVTHPPPRVPPWPTRPPCHTRHTTTPPCHSGVHSVFTVGLQCIYSGKWVSTGPTCHPTGPTCHFSWNFFLTGRSKNGDFQWILVEKGSENLMDF